jgi:hypothetical protein
MSRHLTPIDISNNPGLIHLVEEVKKARQPRILKQDDKPVAVLMPMGTAQERHSTIEVFDHAPLETIKASLGEAGYPEAEVNDMLEALSELPQYANTGNVIR